MGAQQSSLLRIKNDFELVIRCTKDLEYCLESKFGAPSGKAGEAGLHDKITYVQQTHGLSAATVKKMRRLVTLRNKLVHDQTFNSLPDRGDFAKTSNEVVAELKIMASRIGKPKIRQSSCVRSLWFMCKAAAFLVVGLVMVDSWRPYLRSFINYFKTYR